MPLSRGIVLYSSVLFCVFSWLEISVIGFAVCSELLDGGLCSGFYLKLNLLSGGFLIGLRCEIHSYANWGFVFNE